MADVFHDRPNWSTRRDQVKRWCPAVHSCKVGWQDRCSDRERCFFHPRRNTPPRLKGPAPGWCTRPLCLYIAQARSKRQRHHFGLYRPIPPTRNIDVFWTTVCKTVRPMLSDRCPVCNVGVLWPNSWMDQDETRPRPHCVRWGLSFPQKGHSPPDDPGGARPKNIFAEFRAQNTAQWEQPELLMTSYKFAYRPLCTALVESPLFRGGGSWGSGLNP